MSLFKVRDNFRPFEYPQAHEFWRSQINHPWGPDQIEVSADVQGYHIDFTEAERHGINTVLKLFTTYEMNVEDYWISVVYKWFPKYEIRMMASAFASMESVHAVFYDKLNEALNLSSKEFYLSFLEDESMKKRMDTIGKYLEVKTKDDLAKSLATFAFVEGVILYSSFAFLLSFPKRNKLDGVSNGLAYSVRDEGIHSSADCWLFNELVDELKLDRGELWEFIKDISKEFIEVEKEIIKETFAKGRITGITELQLENFVKSRANKMVKQMKFKDNLYKVDYNPIADWFYEDINAPEFSDFFFVNPTSYSHNWSFGNVKKW